MTQFIARGSKNVMNAPTKVYETNGIYPLVNFPPTTRVTMHNDHTSMCM